jgi:hypothetical protein
MIFYGTVLALLSISTLLVLRTGILKNFINSIMLLFIAFIIICGLSECSFDYSADIELSKSVYIE